MDRTRFGKENMIFKALAHPTRLAIVRELLDREKCVNEVKYLLDARQANISQHLAVLRWANIVYCRFKGTMRCYSLKDPKIISELLGLAGRIQT